MDNNWQGLLGVVAIIIAGVSALIAWTSVRNRKDESVTSSVLSLREHEQFRNTTEGALKDIAAVERTKLDIKSFDDWRHEFRHDIDRLELAIGRLDQNKPTTGELNQIAQAFEARLEKVERLL